MIEIGHIYINDYPESAAEWCNTNNAYIEEIEPQNGHRRFEVKAVPAPTPEEQHQALMEQKKAVRAEAVSRITVEVDGMVFDGDEKAQERMSRTVSIATANGMPMTTETTWVLADNTIAQVTLQQLAKACLLAGQKQTELWTVPYQVEETNAGNE